MPTDLMWIGTKTLNLVAKCRKAGGTHWTLDMEIPMQGVARTIEIMAPR